MPTKKKRAMRCGMRNPHKLKVRCYSTCLIDIYDYLAYFPGAKVSDKINETRLNEMFLNRMLNGCSRQDYVQVFDCESIT